MNIIFGNSVSNLSSFLVASKRNFVEIQVMQVDKTALICEALIQSFDTIPNQAHGLISLIDASLIRKLPVSFHEESKYPQLAEYIQTSDDECESSLAKHISCILTSNIFEKQILDGTSEDMLHWAIDSLIRIPLQIFRENLGGRVLPIEMDRNSKDQGTTTISNKRPDFLCWTNGVLIFKGEEKAEIDDFPVAVRELTDKFNKFDPLYFGDIQFMICYVVAGSKLCFYAINGPSNTNPLNHLVPLSNLLDIKNSRDRISILSIIVNIARIIRTVSNTISSTIVPIGKRLKLERSTITFFDVRRVTCKFVWKFQSGISIPSMFSLLIIRYNRRIGSNNIQRYKLNCLNPIQDEKGLHSEEMCLHVAMEISALGGKIKKSTVQAFYERNIKKKNDYISILAELVYG